MNKFEKFKGIVSSESISKLSKKELTHIAGGSALEDAGGSQTSGSGDKCISTCVCTCVPPVDPPKPFKPKPKLGEL